MDISQVETDLNKRIQQSKGWLNSNPEPVSNIPFRGYQWKALPVVILDDPKRVEQHGVGFDFVLDEPSRELRVRLNVRIKPDATIGPKDDSPPFVVIYIVNQETQAEDSIGWHHIRVADSYKDLINLPIDAWFRKWLMHALTCQGRRKIFKPEMQL
jgi:hypothetical protein